MLLVLPPTFEPVLQQIRLQGFFIDGKTRNIAIQLVLPFSLSSPFKMMLHGTIRNDDFWCNTVLRQKASLPIVPCNIIFTLQMFIFFLSERALAESRLILNVILSLSGDRHKIFTTSSP